jgi:predicted lipoprotein with Yx(FWY)xxD motif
MKAPHALTLTQALVLALALPAAALADPAMVGSSSKGKILTDAKGMPLYTFDMDKGGKSACNGACAANWPPLMAAASDKPGDGYTIIKRADGALQWAYDGKPLYTWKGDKKAGDVTGDGFKGVWHLAKPAM